MTPLLITLFSIVVWLNRGQYDPAAIVLVIAFLVWVASRLSPTLGQTLEHKLRPLEPIARRLPLVAGVMMAIKPNIIYLQAGLGPALHVFRFVPLALGLIHYWLNHYRRDPNPLKPNNYLMPLLYSVAFLFVTYLSPSPKIDVFSSNTEAVKFFLQGLNPYSQTYGDIYQGEFGYTPGFLYWPGALYLQTLSYLALHDIRAVNILAWCASLFFIPQGLRIFWMCIPFLAFGFEQSWLDPLLSFFAALSLWSIQNKRWWVLAVAAAIAASIKQYGFLIGFFSLLWMIKHHGFNSGGRKLIFKITSLSASIFLALLLPFLVWGASDFFSMTLASHGQALTRPDALNFSAFWQQVTGTPFPGIAQALMTLLGFALASVHVFKSKQPQPQIIAEAWAIAFGFSMLFGKFAFCNYHWLLISFWMLSLNPKTEGADTGLL